MIADGATIAGYGAAAKATTLLAYCGIDRRHLDYVCDLNDVQAGPLTWAATISRSFRPPRSPTDPPDYVLILAWNFATEIMAQNQAFAAAGGKFIVPVPEPIVVDS